MPCSAHILHIMSPVAKCLYMCDRQNVACMDWTLKRLLKRHDFLDDIGLGSHISTNVQHRSPIINRAPHDLRCLSLHFKLSHQPLGQATAVGFGSS